MEEDNSRIELQKKPNFSINGMLRKYLVRNGRNIKLPINYDDLLHSKGSFPLIDKNGNDTLWESVFYDPETIAEFNLGLTKTYSLLRTDGDISVMEHLQVDRIDYCTFGNSNPFRIRIVNKLNDNYDYYYVKKADASRIYGLELEHILSPNRINYLVHKDTLIEDHIAGIPGDQFIVGYMQSNHFNEQRYNKIRIAKEFIKFNERCFVRLLGDMRAYNYVIDVTPDFEEEQYRIKAIDFDQQSYEGRRSLYLPQFFKENNAFVNLCIELMTPETVKQYQYEERTLITRRVRSAKYRLKDLIDCMRKDTISTPKKVDQLREDLNKHHKTTLFNRCKNMGDLVRMNLKVCLKQAKPVW